MKNDNETFEVWLEDKMWAARCLGIVLQCDFRDGETKARAYLGGDE